MTIPHLPKAMACRFVAATLALCIAPLALAEEINNDEYVVKKVFANGEFREIEGDVVMDAYISFTATDSLDVDVQSITNDIKFALWLYGDAEGKTNLYVTAAGKAKAASNLEYVAENYRLDADVSDGGFHRVTVRAIKDIGPNMMGFLVFIDETLAKCDSKCDEDETDYADKLPDGLVGLDAVVEYYIEQKAFFFSMAHYNSAKAQYMADIGFIGRGAYDGDFGFNVHENDQEHEPSFSVRRVFRLGWEEGVAGFSYKVGESGEQETVVTSDAGTDHIFITVGDENTIYVTEIAYSDASYQGETRCTFNLSKGTRGILKSLQYNFMVGEKKYATLVDAYNSLDSEGGVIRLMRDASDTTSGQFYLTVAKPFTLDLAGYTLSLDSRSGPIFYVYSAGMSLTNGTLKVGDKAQAAFAFPAVGTMPPATISSVDVDGTLVSGSKKNLSIVSGSFNDEAAKDYLADGALCSYRKINGFYLVPESGAEQAKLDAAVLTLDLDKIAAGEATEVEVKALPGFYYGVATGSEPNDLSVETWEENLGDVEAPITLPAPASEGEKGFYRIEMNSTTTNE